MIVAVPPYAGIRCGVDALGKETVELLSGRYPYPFRCVWDNGKILDGTRDVSDIKEILVAAQGERASVMKMDPIP